MITPDTPTHDVKARVTPGRLLAALSAGKKIIGPVEASEWIALSASDRADARVALSWGDAARAVFSVEVKTQNTPLAVRAAIDQSRRNATGGDMPMIVVPYLSPEALAELEKSGVSGVDLCGNGIVVVPGRLYVQRSGQPNRFPQSRPLNNPYRGRSAMVGRMLLAQPAWTSLTELVAALVQAGCPLSMPQVSKAVQALSQDLIVAKTKGRIELTAPLQLLDRLRSAWRAGALSGRQALNLPRDLDVATALSSDGRLRWAVSGASSVKRYAAFAQGGPLRIAVSNLSAACALLNGTPEAIADFGDVELVETDDPGAYFMNEVDDAGLRWASKLQTWLELGAGDARQQQAARDVYEQLVRALDCPV